jgi:hypothetical protein
MCPVEDPEGMFNGEFARHSFDNVWRYLYDPNHPEHGCVTVTYKERLSKRGTSLEAEWLPIETIERKSVLSLHQPPHPLYPSQP